MSERLRMALTELLGRIASDEPNYDYAQILADSDEVFFAKHTLADAVAVAQRAAAPGSDAHSNASGGASAMRQPPTPERKALQVKRVFRPWFWIVVWPRWRMGVRPDQGFKAFSERYGLTRVWRVFGYAISFRRGDPSAPFFYGSWWI